MRSGAEIALSFTMKKQKSAGHPAKEKGAAGANQPIKGKEEVQRSNDEHIDQDFPGFPHPPSKENTISAGSANAFEGTERTLDDDDDSHDRGK